MKIKLWMALVLLVLCSLSAFAQQQQPKEMSAEEKAMMEAWQKAMTPGAAHKLMDDMVGTWDVKVTNWMAPGAPPMTSSGTAEMKWILGNRYIEQRFSGSMMGMPFQGLGYSGYDNVKKQYWATWIDDMSTSIMKTVGNTTDGGKTWRFVGTYPDAMTGKDTPIEERMTVVDKDHHNFELWGQGPDGKMFKMMELQYSRKK